MSRQRRSRKARAARADRVRRPLGLTIAILATAVFYGVMPLLEVYFLRRLEVTADEAYVMGGVEISTWTWVQAAMGGVILIVSLLAWWGRPPWIRFVLIGAISVPIMMTLYRVYETWAAGVDPIFGGPTQEAFRGYLRCQLPFLLFVSLYVIWYINRAPARAFYRRVPLSQLGPASASSDLNQREDTA